NKVTVEDSPFLTEEYLKELVPLIGQRIMIKKKDFLVSQDEKTSATTLDYSTVQTYMVPTIAILLISSVISISLILIFKRRHRRQEAGASPINLKQGFLVAERYAPNPQYSACSASGVPVLRKETLSFLNEVGEGCFGKVFKGNYAL
ncbi:hypothetical protein JTB14_015026, partial [Gonioctena quinquepunctata]